MKPASRFLPLTFVVILFPLLQGCGGGVAASSGANPPPNNNPPPAVTVAISDSYVSLAAKEGHQFMATVTGTENTTVTWSVADCTDDLCGSITSKGYYTAPSQIPAERHVAIKATAQADPSKFATATVHHAPVVVRITPASAWVAPGATQLFTATVEHEIDQLGVIWSLACSDTLCGVLTDPTLTSVMYAAPSALSGPPVVTLKAASIRDPARSSEVTITVKQTSGETLEEGDYAFVFDGWKTYCPPTGWGCGEVRAAIAGQFHADGKGLITSGTEDINVDPATSKIMADTGSYEYVDPGGFETLAITGSYEVESDRRGSLTLTTSKGTARYRISVAASGREGTFISFEEGPVTGMILGSGSFERQDTNAFSLPVLAGPYAFGLFGPYTIWGTDRGAAIGRFEANAAGVLSTGRMDLQLSGGYLGPFQAESYNLAGTLSAPSPNTGRGSLTLNLVSATGGAADSLHFAYYTISADKMLLIETDRPVPRNEFTPAIFSGEARRQVGPFSAASLAGPSIFSMTATVIDWGLTTQDAVIGQLVADGRSSVSGILDGSGNSWSLWWGDPPISNQAFTASYSVDPDGRVVFTNIPVPTSVSQVAYLFGQNQGFLMDAAAEFFSHFGRIEPQDDGPFTANSISGPLIIAAVYPVSSFYSDIAAGWVLFDQNGGVSFIADAVYMPTVNNQVLSVGRTVYVTGTYAVAPNGRGTLDLLQSQLASSQGLAFWVASPSRIVTLAKLTGDYSVLMEFRQ